MSSAVRWAVIVVLLVPIGSIAGQQTVACSATGKALLLQHRLTGAEVQFRKCLEANPNDNASRELLGLALASEGNSKEAEANLERALRSVPESRDFRINLAVFFVKDNEIDKADQVIAPLVDDSGDANLDRLFGYIRFHQHQEREAITWFERALEQAPESVETLYWLGFSYHSVGELGKAMDFYRRALEFDPDHFRSRLQLGKIYLVDGDYSEAEEQLTRATELRPDYPSTWRYLSEAQLFGGNPRAALESARAAVQRGSQDPRNLYQLGTVLRRLGKDEPARAEIETMEKLRATHRNLGDASDN